MRAAAAVGVVEAAAVGVVTSVIQMALNSSKGSRHALQRRRALQAVEPKWAISVVSVDAAVWARDDVTAQGHGDRAVRLARGTGPGGAIPNRCSAARPSSLIQSVVHAGDSCVRTSAAYPWRAASKTMRDAIASMAGHPL